MSLTRQRIERALAVAQVPRVRRAEFLAAFRTGGLDAVAALDRLVADALALEVRYRKAGVRLDTRAQHERGLGEVEP